MDSFSIWRHRSILRGRAIPRCHAHDIALLLVPNQAVVFTLQSTNHVPDVELLRQRLSLLSHADRHVWMGQVFGAQSHILLQGMGGLAIGANNLRSGWQRVLVLAAGPGIQLLLWGALWGALWAGYRPEPATSGPIGRESVARAARLLQTEQAEQNEPVEAGQPPLRSAPGRVDGTGTGR